MRLRLKSFEIACLLTALIISLSGYVRADTESFVGVTTGADANLRSELNGGVHTETVVLRHTKALDEEIIGWDVVALALPSAQNIPFPAAPTTCVSVLIVADARNSEAIWVDTTGAGAQEFGNAIPLYPGTRQMFRSPNSGNCDEIKIKAPVTCLIGGINPCRAYAVTQ